MRDLAWLSVLSQHTPGGPPAPLLSIRNSAAGRKAILALRLGLTSSRFAAIGFKPSLLHLHLDQALSSPSSCTSLPPQHPGHRQAWDQLLPRHCCLSFLERQLSLTWQGLSQPTSSNASHRCTATLLALSPSTAVMKATTRSVEARGGGTRTMQAEAPSVWALASCTKLPSLPLTKHLPSKIPSHLFLVLMLCFHRCCHNKIPCLFAIALYYPVTHKKLKPLCT